MAPSGQLTSSALQALLQGGELASPRPPVAGDRTAILGLIPSYQADLNKLPLPARLRHLGERLGPGPVGGHLLG
jgi:hypothetical protein